MPLETLICDLRELDVDYTSIMFAQTHATMQYPFYSYLSRPDNSIWVIVAITPDNIKIWRFTDTDKNGTRVDVGVGKSRVFALTCTLRRSAGLLQLTPNAITDRLLDAGIRTDVFEGIPDYYRCTLHRPSKVPTVRKVRTLLPPAWLSRMYDMDDVAYLESALLTIAGRCHKSGKIARAMEAVHKPVDLSNPTGYDVLSYVNVGLGISGIFCLDSFHELRKLAFMANELSGNTDSAAKIEQQLIFDEMEDVSLYEERMGLEDF